MDFPQRRSASVLGCNPKAKHNGHIYAIAVAWAIIVAYAVPDSYSWRKSVGTVSSCIGPRYVCRMHPSSGSERSYRAFNLAVVAVEYH